MAQHSPDKAAFEGSIPSPTTIHYCRHDHGAEAIAHVRTPEGCFCFPDDREQWLCWQHLDKLDHAPYEIIWMAQQVE